MILLVHLRQALPNHSVSIDFHGEKPHLDGNAEMDFFVHDINSYFMLGSIIPTNGEVEFRSMKILEIVLTEQICQVAFGAQTLRKHQKHEVMWREGCNKPVVGAGPVGCWTLQGLISQAVRLCSSGGMGLVWEQ